MYSDLYGENNQNDETVVLLYHQRKIEDRKHIEMVYEPDDSYLEDVNRKVTYSDIKE